MAVLHSDFADARIRGVIDTTEADGTEDAHLTVVKFERLCVEEAVSDRELDFTYGRTLGEGQREHLPRIRKHKIEDRHIIEDDDELALDVHRPSVDRSHVLRVTTRVHELQFAGEIDLAADSLAGKASAGQRSPPTFERNLRRNRRIGRRDFGRDLAHELRAVRECALLSFEREVHRPNATAGGPETTVRAAEHVLLNRERWNRRGQRQRVCVGITCTADCVGSE